MLPGFGDRVSRQLQDVRPRYTRVRRAAAVHLGRERQNPVIPSIVIEKASCGVCYLLCQAGGTDAKALLVIYFNFHHSVG